MNKITKIFNKMRVRSIAGIFTFIISYKKFAHPHRKTAKNKKSHWEILEVQAILLAQFFKEG